MKFTKAVFSHWIESKEKEEQYAKDFQDAGGSAYDAKENLLAMKFVVRYWRRVGRKEAKDRGLVIADDSFAYSCTLLGDDLKCSVYEYRPRICRSYPTYEGAFVPEICGYADLEGKSDERDREDQKDSV
jgi:Fe-S-cluster containining protein